MQTLLSPCGSLIRTSRCVPRLKPSHNLPSSPALVRSVHRDGRSRLSNVWVPTGGITPAAGAAEDAASKLIRGGFLRQAHSGFFHLLPLGLRIQEKLEKLIDKHMSKLGALKLSLSTFSSPDLWKKSGRYKDDNAELFQMQDRKGAHFLLSPTHEEEITALVSGIVNSYKQLPLLLYQISRKYRDEPRPRQGLLRTREFLMKDLYTFDVDELKASSTYQKVRKAYDDFFNELRVPVLVARAYSGEIGGKLSHEYHIATTSGEDTIISCVSCKFAYNEELVPTKLKPREFERSTGDLGPYQTWFGISKDRCHLVEAILPRFLEPPEPHSPARKEAQANTCLIRSRYPELDLSIERPFNAFVEHWKGKHLSGINPGSQVLPLPHLTQIYDYRVSEDVIQSRGAGDPEDPLRRSLSTIIGSRCLRDTTSLDLARPHDGGKCPNCGEESLKLQQAVELGHTFHLGKRYSEPMKAKFVAKPTQQTKDQAVNKGGSTPPQSGQEYFHMGCHGIGISRMIAAVADALADKRGLIWPRAMAPYEAVILATEEHTTAAEGVLDMLTRREDRSDPVDAILDDRDKDFGWKLQDADLIGFPIVIILGSKFGKSGLYEVSVRRLGTCQKVAVANLRGYVTSKLAKI